MKRLFVYEHLTGSRHADLAAASVTELLPLGRAMRDAVVADALALGDYEVTAADTAPPPGLPAGAKAAHPHVDESAVAFVARMAAGADATWVIAPETDGVLADLAGAVEPARWLGCDRAAIALAASKRATLECLAAHGIATPLAQAQDPAIRRWVVKPDDGAGATDTRVHASHAAAAADAEQRRAAGRTVVLEPWIDGEAMSLSLLVGATGCELLSINRQTIAVDAVGHVRFDGVEPNRWPLGGAGGGRDARGPAIDPLAAASAFASLPAIASLALARQVAAAMPGLRGFVGVDLVWHARRGPVVIEVNPRVTCAYVGLSRALGRNLAGDVIAACRGPAAAAMPPPGSAR